jgi:hypothetical protein
MLFLILASAAVIVLVEAPPLVKKKKWKDLSVFTGFLLIGLTLGFVLVFRLPFPNPTPFIEGIFKPVTEALFGKG